MNHHKNTVVLGLYYESLLKSCRKIIYTTFAN